MGARLRGKCFDCWESRMDGGDDVVVSIAVDPGVFQK